MSGAPRSEPKPVQRRHALSFCDERHLGLEGRHFLYECCEDCNYARHRCHFCGDDTSHDEGGVHPACIPDGADIGSSATASEHPADCYPCKGTGRVVGFGAANGGPCPADPWGEA